jgi:parvulin-like peptidyl-prolyl isomerase
MLDRVRIWFASVTGRGTQGRRISRREREESQRKLLILGISIAAIVLVVVLAAGAYYQYIYYPGQTLASVNGKKISRSDYWKVRKLDLLNQVSQYGQLAQFSTGDQQTQYKNLAQQAQTQLTTVKSDSADPNTLDQMVTDQIVLDSLSKLGISISSAELDEYQAQQFASSSIGSPTPTLPIDPTAAAWATATANAQATASAEASPSASPSAGAAASPATTPSSTPAAQPTSAATSSSNDVAASPSAQSGLSESATPAAGSPTAGTPSASPSEISATPTVSPADARATAESNFSQYTTTVLKQAGMSVSDFRRLILKPSLARQKVSDKLEAQVPTRASQIHAAHILVATQDAANTIVNTELKSKSFEDVAKAQSTDSTTSPNGGDLGWVPQGVLSPEFDKVAFALKVGEVSKPFQDKFGWEIVKVLDRQDDRPVTTSTLSQIRNNKVNDWLDQARSSAKIKWNVSQAEPQPTAQTQFAPPPDAPPTPTPLPTPTPAPPGAATPGAATPAP